MKKSKWMPWLSLIVIILIIAGMVYGADRFKQMQPSVYVLTIKGMVDEGMKAYVERGIKEAEEKKAKAIILHINTLGGLVDPAMGIAETLGEARVPVYSYVQKNAISAGALIAFCGQKPMCMPLGTLIGDAQMVTLEGKPLDESKEENKKRVSYWRAYFRTTAEANGYDPKIAEAMVSPDIEIEGVVEKGKLLTLTAREAERLEQAVIVKNLDDAVKRWGLQEYRQAWIRPATAEGIAGFLSHPVISQLLLLIGIIALLIEIFTPGFGVPGITGVVCLSLFFGGRIVAGLAGYEVVFFFALGVVLLILELFVIPGFGVAGVAGIAAILASIGMSYQTGQEAMLSISITLVSTLLVMLWLWYFLGATGFINRLVLQTSLESGQGYNVTPKILPGIGDTGVALTPLRPAGAADFDGRRIDVVSEGVFIPRGSEVKVIRIEGNRVTVVQK